MTATAAIPEIRSGGIPIDPSSLGWLIDSSELLNDPRDPGQALRDRIDHEGYLYLKGILDPNEVAAARESVCRRLLADGHLDPTKPPIDAVWSGREQIGFKPEYASGNPEVEQLVYGQHMLDLFRTLLGGPVAHYDFTWLRAMAPGKSSPPHCDVVYMGRGDTKRLYTCWTPLGDIGFDTGGLLVLEGSCRDQRLRETYGKHDVDTHCINKEGSDGWKDSHEWVSGEVGSGGALGKDCNRISRGLGNPRWLTTEYSAGDVMIFGMYTVHCGMENPSKDRIRLSTDSRYQPLGTTMDERWIGKNPPGHSQAGKRGRVC